MESSTHTVRLTGRLDPRDAWVADGCPIAAALEVVSTRSALLLLREAFYGTTRFDDFAERVGISQPVAATRLRELVEAGLLEKRPYREPGQRARERYELTQMGAELFPVLLALMKWGDRWVTPSGVTLVHRDCGEPVQAEIRCAAGHEVPLDELDLVATRSRARTGR